MRVRSLTRSRKLMKSLAEGEVAAREHRDALLRERETRRLMAAMIVHDLKSPLTGILFNASFMGSLASAPPEVRGSAQSIARAARVMDRMIMDVLDVELSTAGLLKTHRTLVTPRALVAEWEHVGLHGEGYANHAVMFEIDTDIGEIYVDAALIRRALDNLIDNATKYAPRDATIRVRIRNLGDTTRIEVADEGQGIPAELRATIFEPFVRLGAGDDVNARRSRGIGLAFCRIAAEVHGGKIWVEDNEPVGARFCIELPRVMPARH